MLITALKKEKQETFEKGKLEGKLESQIKTAERMLVKGFEMALIAELTGLPEAEILKH
jgi:predicted transposase/invertase (TIGR01784 family)